MSGELDKLKRVGPIFLTANSCAIAPGGGEGNGMITLSGELACPSLQTSGHSSG